MKWMLIDSNAGLYMIKKQLGMLTGAILVASSADAALVSGSVGSNYQLGTDSSAVLVLSTVGQGAYVIDLGSPQNLAVGMSIDMTAASAALGGSIDNYALFGNLGGSYYAYNYNDFQYVDVNGGVVYAKAIAGSLQPANNLDNSRQNIINYIANASEGLNPEGSLGDIDNNAFGLSTFLQVGALNNAGEQAALFQQVHTEVDSQQNSFSNVVGYIANNQFYLLDPGDRGIYPSGSVGNGSSVGSDSAVLIVLSRLGAGAYIINTGLTPDQLLATENFSIDLVAASAALGGEIDSYAVFANVGGTSAEQRTIQTGAGPGAYLQMNQATGWGAVAISTDSPVGGTLAEFGLDVGQTTADFQWDQKLFSGAGGGMGVKIESWNETAVISDSGDQFAANTGSGWETFSYNYTIAPGATRLKVILLGINNDSVMGFDNVTITNAINDFGSGSSLVPNGDFESGFDSWGFEFGGGGSYSIEGGSTAEYAVDVNGGILYAQPSPASVQNAQQLMTSRAELINYLGSAYTALNTEGSAGDLDSSAQFSGLLGSGLLTDANLTSQLYLQTISASATQQIQVPSRAVKIIDNTLYFGGLAVAINAPADGAEIDAGSSVAVTVNATSVSGALVASCELSVNNTVIGQDAEAPYEFLLNDLSSGTYNLLVSCADVQGAQNSDQKTFYVVNPTVIGGDIVGTVNNGESTTGFLTATDADGLADGSYYAISQLPAHGQALVNPSSGFWVYLAGSFYVGADNFNVEVTDDLGNITTQVIAITVEGIDTDADTVYDFEDNCPSTPNSLQENVDNDALGDVCDDDIDGDNVSNALDAFPYDATETMDTDADLVGDNADNCVTDFNPSQSNVDGDAYGDFCDDDIDGDGLSNVVELRFGGNTNDASDSALVMANIESLALNGFADTDNDSVPDAFEIELGTDLNDAQDAQQALDTLRAGFAKAVPAVGGFGLLLLGLSMATLGFFRRKR